MLNIRHPGSSLIKQLTYSRKGIGSPLKIKTGLDDNSYIGHYAGLIEFGDSILGITTDGVGSKVIIANEMRKWDTIGIDCIAMNVNDLIAMNIEPISFVDYIAIDMRDDEIMAQIGKGLTKGAEISNISIVGGETAVLPNVVKGFDLVGMCIGMAKKDQIITGEKVEIGDAIVGLPSTGIHSNGYTKVRKILKNNYNWHNPFPYNINKTIGDELLTPTKIYMEILDVAKRFNIHGLAHITGGGLLKLHRITKYGFNFTDPLEPQPIFKFLQEEGLVEDLEMYKTFNMGMGFAVVLSQKEAKDVAEVLNGKIVGEIIDDGIYIKGFKIE